MSSSTSPEATAIYQALLSWSESAKAAHMRERLQETAGYAVPIPRFQQATVDPASSTSAVKAVGLLTQLVQDLPSLARVLLSVAMLVLGLMCCFVYVRGLRWGSQIGKAHGDSSSRPYFASGVSGLVGGMVFTRKHSSFCRFSGLMSIQLLRLYFLCSWYFLDEIQSLLLRYRQTLFWL